MQLKSTALIMGMIIFGTCLGLPHLYPWRSGPKRLGPPPSPSSMSWCRSFHVLTSESIRKSVLDLEQRALCGTLRVQGRRLADPKEVLSEHDKLQLTKVAKSLGRIKKKPPPTQQIFEASTAAMRKMGTSAKIAQHLVMWPPAKGIVMEVKIIWI